jgi:hypothetical protein
LPPQVQRAVFQYCKRRSPYHSPYNSRNFHMYMGQRSPLF